MSRIDKLLLQFVSKWLTNHFSDSIESATYSEQEDYQIDMKVTLKNGVSIPLEVKSSRSQCFKKGDNWNPYFRTNGTGLFRNFTWPNDTVPETVTDKYAYIISSGWAPDKNTYSSQSLWGRLMAMDLAYFLYVAPDGIVLWNNKQLSKAFLGHFTMYCPRTNDFGRKDVNPELKAVIDLSRGTYFKFTKEEQKEISQVFSTLKSQKK